MTNENIAAVQYRSKVNNLINRYPLSDFTIKFLNEMPENAYAEMKLAINDAKLNYLTNNTLNSFEEYLKLTLLEQLTLMIIGSYSVEALTGFPAAQILILNLTNEE